MTRMVRETVFHIENLHAPPAPWRSLNTGDVLPFKPLSSVTVRRILCGPRGVRARAAVRKTLLNDLHAITGKWVTVRETKGGPEVVERIRSRELSISISYAGAEAWLALGWDCPIGIDAVEISRIPEWEQLASTYLGPRALERLRFSSQRDLDFAMEWAGYEARLKLHGFEISEELSAPNATLCEACFGKVVVVVAAHRETQRKSPVKDLPTDDRIAVSLLDASRVQA